MVECVTCLCYWLLMFNLWFIGWVSFKFFLRDYNMNPKTSTMGTPRPEFVKKTSVPQQNSLFECTKTC